jgi:hypothetical protein
MNTEYPILKPTPMQDDEAWVATMALERHLAEETRQKKFTLVLNDGIMVWEEVRVYAL